MPKTPDMDIFEILLINIPILSDRLDMVADIAKFLFEYV